MDPAFLPFTSQVPQFGHWYHDPVTFARAQHHQFPFRQYGMQSEQHRRNRRQLLQPLGQSTIARVDPYFYGSDYGAYLPPNLGFQQRAFYVGPGAPAGRMDISKPNHKLVPEVNR